MTEITRTSTLFSTLPTTKRFFSALEKSKITSLHQVSLHHLELWIEDSFVQIDDHSWFEFLALAWSRAQQDNFPFLDTCNVYFNYKDIQTTPIKTHAILTKIFLIGINLHVDKNLPDIWVRQSRDIDKIFSKDDIYSLWRWLLFHDTSGLNKGSGVTIMITDKIAKDLQHTEFLEGRIINLIFGFKKSN
ncbi:hypothetical protein RhiirB3_459026 [Rhizophagus irregularis]|nr:hypothetical protein RhiirB3_459026 [Rhizophagus irregularis]